jgi:hypothetical protein
LLQVSGLQRGSPYLGKKHITSSSWPLSHFDTLRLLAGKA